MVVGSIVTIKPTPKDTIILEPYYGNEGNAQRNHCRPSANARWNGLVTYFIHDFNDQQQPHAFSLRVRGEIWEDAGGVRCCVGGNNFNGGTNACAGVPGGFHLAVAYLIPATGRRSSPDSLGRHLHTSIQAGSVTHHESGVPV